MSLGSLRSFSVILISWLLKPDERDCGHSLDLTPTADCLSLARNPQLHFACRTVTARRLTRTAPRPPVEIPVCANTAAPALTEKLAVFVGTDAEWVQLSSVCPLFWLNELRSGDSPEKPFDFAAGALRGGLPLRFPRLHSRSAAARTAQLTPRTAAMRTRPSRSDPFREVALHAQSRRPCVLPNGSLDRALQIGLERFANGSLDRALAPERSGARTSTARAKIAVAVAMRRDLNPSNILPDGPRPPVIADLRSGRGLGAGMMQRVRTMSDPAPEVQRGLAPFEVLTRVHPLRLRLAPCAHRGAQTEMKLWGCDSDLVLIELQRMSQLFPVE
jgi:hypothetical protein